MIYPTIHCGVDKRPEHQPRNGLYKIAIYIIEILLVTYIFETTKTQISVSFHVLHKAL